MKTRDRERLTHRHSTDPGRQIKGGQMLNSLLLWCVTLRPTFGMLDAGSLCIVPPPSLSAAGRSASDNRIFGVRWAL